MRLFLIRHPPPQVAAGLCYGRSDLALADPAALPAAATALRRQLPATAPLYSSPLQRCRLLAERLHAAPRYDERLLEMAFGDWEMRPWEAIERAALDAWAADPLGFAPPGGESAGALLARVAAFHAGLRVHGDAAAEVVVVAHAGVLKALHGHVRGLPPAEWMRLEFAFGELTLLDDGG